MKTRTLQLAIVAASAFASGATAHADLVFGSLWEVGGATNGGGIQYATLTNIPATTPDVTFSLNSPLTFDSRNAVNGYTIGGWLSTGGATILTGASQSGNSMNNIFVEITGLVSVTSGQQFTVTHDDGMTLVIGGQTVIDAPGPTSPNQTIGTYTGLTGDQPFTLVYSEVDGPPAVLQLGLPLAVPEPTTTRIAGSLLLLVFGASALRRLRKARKATPSSQDTFTVPPESSSPIRSPPRVPGRLPSCAYLADAPIGHGPVVGSRRPKKSSEAKSLPNLLRRFSPPFFAGEPREGRKA